MTCLREGCENPIREYGGQGRPPMTCQDHAGKRRSRGSNRQASCLAFGCDEPARLRSPGRGATPKYCSPECAELSAPGKRRAHKLFYKYGLSVAAYDQLLAAQEGACAICGASGPEASRFGVLVVDHDHETGEVRGLLCSKCNCAIGLLGDSPELIVKAAAYLAAKLPLKEETRA